MRRWIAALFLVLTAFYVGAAGLDRCEDGNTECVQICQLLCSDGCSVAPLPTTPTPPPPDPLPRNRYEHEQAPALISLNIEPEKDPPKA
ncbi:MAG: hypothetical protein IPQ13_08650 [Holophagaceae bacterium]|nr:hypothetical protein [Holophagaceae bacterium]